MNKNDFYAYIPLANEPRARRKAEAIREIGRQKARRRSILKYSLYLAACAVIGITLGLTATHHDMNVWNLVALVAATGYITAVMAAN